MKIVSFSYLVFLFSSTSYAQTVKTENLKFLNFDVQILNFVSASRPVSLSNSGRIDTLIINEDPCESGSYIRGKTLKILPKFRSDSFALSFAYKVHIFSVSGNLTNDNWIYYANYVTIPRSNEAQFTIPAYKDNRYTKSIKKRYNFRDTLITVESEGFPDPHQFTRNGQVFRDEWEDLYLRIRRFNNGKLIESKYIVVELRRGCD
jgi:hypothetical protein